MGGARKKCRKRGGGGGKEAGSLSAGGGKGVGGWGWGGWGGAWGLNGERYLDFQVLASPEAILALPVAVAEELDMLQGVPGCQRVAQVGEGAPYHALLLQPVRFQEPAGTGFRQLSNPTPSVKPHGPTGGRQDAP
jgi:hypothetical protein